MIIILIIIMIVIILMLILLIMIHLQAHHLLFAVISNCSSPTDAAQRPGAT